MNVLFSVLVFSGSALMAFNIASYIRLSRDIQSHQSLNIDRRFYALPTCLLVLFLAGYLAVGFFGEPDLIVAFILFGGSIFVLVMLLLTQRTLERIREAEKLQSRVAAAEEASRAKTVFLSNMSHDIRTPLNAIIGYTALADRDGITPEEQHEFIRKIDAAGHQLLEIINDVLEMSRIESGKIEPAPAPMNLEACVREAADLIRTQMENKHITFETTCEAEHPWVECDAGLMARVLINLLGNAQKFTDAGGFVRFSLRETSWDGNSASFEIRVLDNGIGMSEEFVERVFVPFERERTSTVSTIQGTGLGLSITKTLVELMGGSISVRTAKSEGTEFCIRITLPEALPCEEEKPRVPASFSFDGMRALLVEDNPINMEIAQAILEQAGFSLETAENGQEAVDMVSASAPGHYDLVLMDLQMPVMDGLTAARAIRALPDSRLSGIPIVAMTANAFQEDIRNTEEAGMNAHIAKPLDVPVMMETLQKVLQETERKNVS